MLEVLKKVKETSIKALFSDDDLMDTFVLKGGTALELYNLHDRASIDIDVSMSKDFKIEDIKPKLESIFIDTFKLENYHLFDFNMFMRPGKENFKQGHFWGGYCIEFKVIDLDKKKGLKDDINELRKNAEVVSTNNGKKYKIDISKYEYCEIKKEMDLDGYSIYVYTPLMIVNEKLRAICQQMDAYRDIVETNKKPRARDFYDIYNIMNNIPGIKEQFDTPKNKELLSEIFSVKKVPLKLIHDIEKEKDLHKPNFNTVKDTVSTENVKEFDFYFEFVVDLVSNLAL